MFLKRCETFLLLLLLGSFLFVPKSYAQMMNYYAGQITVTPTQEDVQEIQEGNVLYEKFQNKQVMCSTLKDADFEKIGEYVMEQRFGNTQQHIQMNYQMKQMMGEQGEETMHINLGKSATRCAEKGGGIAMMGFNGYGWNMMGGLGYGFGIAGALFWLVAFVDLVLLGIFLWKRIRK